jgi:hypothetical protein
MTKIKDVYGVVPSEEETAAPAEPTTDDQFVYDGTTVIDGGRF